MSAAHLNDVLRSRDDPAQGDVSFVELFFDLVFVFAVTQLSHHLINHLSLAGALQTGLMTLAVWWVWIFTSWATNLLNPEAIHVRLMLFVGMASGLVMAASIPMAFGERALFFACAYVVMQVGRSIFAAWAVRAAHHDSFMNFIRIGIWFALSGICWIAGALAEGGTRVALWCLAITLELGAPALGFRVPGLGRSAFGDWNVSGPHMAERCGLFVILALGETILVTGASFAAIEWTLATSAAFLAGLLASIAMWWIYFNMGAERAEKKLEDDEQPGRLAGVAYSYLHIVIIAGIIITGAADQIVLKPPKIESKLTTALIVIGGPALFVLGCLLFKRATLGLVLRSHVAGLAVAAVALALHPWLPPLALAWTATGMLVMVASWETLSRREPSPEP